MNIYLDDERTPRGNGFDIVVRTYEEFCELIDSIDYIKHVSFDHDLGTEKTGMDCLRYMVEQDMDREVFDKDFLFNDHTANPCGRDNMCSYIKSYLKFIKED